MCEDHDHSNVVGTNIYYYFLNSSIGEEGGAWDAGCCTLSFLCFLYPAAGQCSFRGSYKLCRLRDVDA